MGTPGLTSSSGRGNTGMLQLWTKSILSERMPKGRKEEEKECGRKATQANRRQGTPKGKVKREMTRRLKREVRQEPRQNEGTRESPRREQCLPGKRVDHRHDIGHAELHVGRTNVQKEGARD